MTRFIDEQRTLFGAVTNQSNPHEKSSLEIRLPTIHIQPFSGEYKEWPSFKDLFLSSVDKREGLSDSHKLQYLKGLLRGEAACLIKHISVTEANYSEAWSKLTARYDKKRYILNDYIKTFINQATVSQSSSTQLRKLTDTSDEIIRGIAALGEEAEGRDPWLVHIILNKTDSETRKTWAETNASNDLATLQELLNFLSKRCDALETFEPSAKKPTVSHKPTLRILHSDVSVKCPECSEQHPIFKCPRFKTLDVQARRSLVAKLNLCFNCLSTGHRAQKCKSKFSCHFCRQQHHSSLHLNEVMRNNRVTSHVSHSELTHNSNTNSSTLNPHTPAFTHIEPRTPTPQAIGDSQIHSLTSFKRHRNLLSILPTALVNVMDSTGNLQLCRMLIDSGSQASFITEDCVQRLGLKSTRVKIPVQGLGSIKSGLTKGKLTLSISSRFSQSQQIKVQAYILSSLTSAQPSTSFNIAHLSYVKNYQVADPHFNKPGKIDILLGAEYFIEILKPGQYIASHDRPALQNTIFEYIIAGCLNQTTGSVPLISCHADMPDIDTTLRRFWEVEDIPHQGSLLTIEEAACEAHFNKTHYTDPETSRYTVRLPFKTESEALGDSLDMAVRRFQALERKFKLNPALHKEYSNFIHEYRELSHLEPVPLNLLHSNEEHHIYHTMPSLNLTVLQQGYG